MTQASEQEIFDVMRQMVEDDERHARSNGSQPPIRFKLTPFEQIQISTAPDYVVKGIIPRVGLAVVWGRPKCGKSFWTFDLAMHVALGREYRGRRVQQGPVVYLALEGGHGFRNRVEAWRRRHLDGYPDRVPFYLLDVPLDLVAERDKLIAAIRTQLADMAPVAIVIDTLNRALIGDENKSDDMAKFIRASDMIRVAFGCVVIIIHHCGIAGSRPRGHTSLSGADDAQIAVERDADGLITIKIEHMKDGDASAPMACKLERIELGNDDDGDPITSCVVVPLDDSAARARRPKLSAVAKLALDLLQELAGEVGEAITSTHIPADAKAVSAMLWRETFYKAHIDEKRDTRKRKFSRAVERLQELKLIGVWSDWVWLTGQTGQAGH